MERLVYGIVSPPFFCARVKRNPFVCGFTMRQRANLFTTGGQNGYVSLIGIANLLRMGIDGHIEDPRRTIERNCTR